MEAKDTILCQCWNVSFETLLFLSSLYNFLINFIHVGIKRQGKGGVDSDSQPDGDSEQSSSRLYVVVLEESREMEKHKHEVINGYNSFLENQPGNSNVWFCPFCIVPWYLFKICNVIIISGQCSSHKV